MKRLRWVVRSSDGNAGRLLVLGGLLAGFGVRLLRLGAESLWYDETVSVHLARLPLGEMLAHTAGDIHPPGYYALLHAWQALVQPSLAHGLEFLFAWPSHFFGVLALPLLYAIGRRLFGERVGVAALWLAALNPFQVWYSQEVRMYTLGALLGLLCLWAVLQFAGRPPGAASPRPAARRGWLLVYVLCAAAGLYTLYYFLFLLPALNLIALLFIWLYEADGAHGPEGRPALAHRWRQTAAWLAAQLGVLLLWLPWLPIFWRQATDPPVPPWRSTWDSPAALLGSLYETLAALLVGQTPPGGRTWPWATMAALLLAGLVALAFLRARRQTTAAARTRLWLHVAIILLYVFVPIAVLYTATLLGAPIYHVRYLAIYAPLFLLAPAWVLTVMWRLRAWLGATMWAGLLLVSALALVAFWTDPLYRADDHRGAVAALAQAWRPGDAILANAGWIYPVLTTYWPDTAAAAPAGAPAAAPPPLQPPVRLLDYAQNAAALSLATPLIVRSGSLDGSPSLGWGNPASDFFAISRAQTETALDALAGQARRIWHYRLYDTVSDPGGVLRAWLAEQTELLTEKQIPGRDFGLVQLYATQADVAQETGIKAETQEPGLGAAPPAVFGEALVLVQATAQPTITAGSYLYVDLLWQALPPLASLPADLSFSLRLYDAQGEQKAQADGPPDLTPTRSWEAGATHRQIAALPVPVNTPPGVYSLYVIVYGQDTAEALPVGATGLLASGIGWVEVTASEH